MKRTFIRANGTEITINDFDGIEQFAKDKGWTEKPKRKARAKSK